MKIFVKYLKSRFSHRINLKFKEFICYSNKAFEASENLTEIAPKFKFRAIQIRLLFEKQINSLNFKLIR
jgi:hypothetical protein